MIHRHGVWVGLVAWLLMGWMTHGASDDAFERLVADRWSIERVYHEHRIGVKAPFEQAMPRSVVEQLVRQELKKQRLLESVYSTRITTNQITAELRRMDATSRAPEVLKALKAALSNDEARFVAVVVLPALVDQALRVKFDDDPSLHQEARQRVENVRSQLLKARAEGKTGLAPGGAECERRTVVWKLGPRATQRSSSDISLTLPTQPAKVAAKSAHYSIEGTLQASQVLQSPQKEELETEWHIDDLPIRLRSVLLEQLKKKGDVSAVIEMPGEFGVFRLVERSDSRMSVEQWVARKKLYESWLNDHP